MDPMWHHYPCHVDAGGARSRLTQLTQLTRLTQLTTTAQALGAHLPPAGFIALAAIVAFFAIDRESLWLDETVSVVQARMPLAGMIEAVFADVGGNMLAYQLLLQRWIRLLGDSPAAVRALSAVFAVLAAVAVYALCRRGAGRSWALVGAIVFVAHVLFLSYAQEARAYSIALLAVAVAALAYLRLLERPTIGRLAAYVLCGAAMAWIHFMLGLVIAAHAIHALVWNRVQWRWWTVAFGLIAVAWLPVLLAMATFGGEPISWIAPLSDGWLRQLSRLAGGQWLVPVWVLLAVGGLALAIRRRSSMLGFAVVSLAGPVAMAAVVSVVQPVFLARYLVSVLPAMALLVACIGARIGRAWVVPAVVIVAMLASGTIGQVARTSKPPWESAFPWVLARSTPADGIVFYPEFEHFPFDYYMPRLDTAGVRPTRVAVDEGAARLWLVVFPASAPSATPAPGLAALLAEIGARYGEPAEQLRFGRIQVGLYELPASTSDGPAVTD
jgi:mannosyltransferase